MKENALFPFARETTNFQCGCRDDSCFNISVVTIPNDKGAYLCEILLHCPLCNNREVFCFRECFEGEKPNE